MQQNPTANKFWSNLKSFGAQVESKVFTGKQWAEETLTKTAETTPLPAEYVDLETRVDKIRLLHERMLSTTKAFIKHTDFDVPISDSIAEMGEKFGQTLASLGGKAVDAMSGAPSLPAAPQPVRISMITTDIKSKEKNQ
jgi:hypothetical protein